MLAEPRFKSPLAIDPAARTLTAVISTVDPDRAGDVILPEGLANADEFLRNPVVLWAHQRTMPPIGTCVDLQIRPDKIIATTRFASGVPFAEDVFRLYEQGVLRGWSIGFVPRRVVPKRPRGHRVEAWDLLEYSAVPVPENPAALTLAVRSGVIHDPGLFEWLRRFHDPFADLVA